MHPIRKQLAVLRENCVDEAKKADEAGDTRKAWLWKMVGSFIVDAIRAVKRIEAIE